MAWHLEVLAFWCAHAAADGALAGRELGVLLTLCIEEGECCGSAYPHAPVLMCVCVQGGGRERAVMGGMQLAS